MAKSAIGSALGFLTTITTRVMAGTKGNEEAVLSLPEDIIKSLADEFALKLVKATKPIKNVMNVLVDYIWTLSQMISTGHFDYVNPDITQEHFILPIGEKNVDVEFVHYGCMMETDAVLKNLETVGLRPATLPELLALAAVYPWKQREFAIVALGSIWVDSNGRSNVTCIGERDHMRGLYLYWNGRMWGSLCRFAAVRK